MTALRTLSSHRRGDLSHFYGNSPFLAISREISPQTLRPDNEGEPFVRGLTGRARCRPFLFAFRHRDQEPASGPVKQQGVVAAFSSERRERLGKTWRAVGRSGPLCGRTAGYDRRPERQRDAVEFRSAAGASAYLFRVWGCGTRAARSPTPDLLLLIAVGMVAGVGFGVLDAAISFGIGVLAS
jgi:hypothetical protein